jgi:hypothetical protein
LRVQASVARVIAQTPGFIAVDGMGSVAIVDERAVVRLIVARAIVVLTTAAGSASAIASTIEEHTSYGDVGRALPDLWLLAGGRIVELTGLTDAESAIALAADEVAGMPEATPIAIVAAAKRA